MAGLFKSIKMESKEKLYVCLEEGDNLSLHTRADVDAIIKDVEEDHDGTMPFTVVGNVTTPVDGTPFLVTYKVGSSTYYEVVTTKEGGPTGPEILQSKKRLKGKKIDVLAFRNLSQLITDFYE